MKSPCKRAESQGFENPLGSNKDSLVPRCARSPRSPYTLKDVEGQPALPDVSLYLVLHGRAPGPESSLNRRCRAERDEFVRATQFRAAVIRLTDATALRSMQRNLHPDRDRIRQVRPSCGLRCDLRGGVSPPAAGDPPTHRGKGRACRHSSTRNPNLTLAADLGPRIDAFALKHAGPMRRRRSARGNSMLCRRLVASGVRSPSSSAAPRGMGTPAPVSLRRGRSTQPTPRSRPCFSFVDRDAPYTVSP